MSWEYRVLREELDNGEFGYFIAEVYYDNEDGSVIGWTDSDYNPTARWDNVSDLQGTVKRMLGAFDKPVICIVNGQAAEESSTQHRP